MKRCGEDLSGLAPSALSAAVFSSPVFAASALTGLASLSAVAFESLSTAGFASFSAEAFLSGVAGCSVFVGGFVLGVGSAASNNEPLADAMISMKTQLAGR